MEKCEATIGFGDDYGDNECTFECLLVKNHSGRHEEFGNLYGQKYRIQWEDKKDQPEEKAKEA